MIRLITEMKRLADSHYCSPKCRYSSFFSPALKVNTYRYNSGSALQRYMTDTRFSFKQIFRVPVARSLRKNSYTLA